MNQPTHTPGPWIADHSGTGDAIVTAKCGWLNKDGSKLEPVIVQRASWPDARLIAAAPDLLSCLKEAEQDIRLVATILEQKGTPLTAEKLRSRVATYAAAIAKAEGKL